MEIDPYQTASVQYNDWMGTVAGDQSDTQDWEELLGIDTERWRLLHVTIYFSGGSQWIEPYVISADTSYDDLQGIVNSGQPIVLTHLEGIEYHFPDHSDTNPPRPRVLPIVSAAEFISHAFKRFEIKLVYRHIPPEATFEVVDISDSEDFE